MPSHRGGELRPATYARGSEEFGRILAFSDGLFAIAMTLLVVGIAVPTLADKQSVDELWQALRDDSGSFVSFVISFLVIGRYWAAHHQFVGRLAAIDGGLIGLNLLYLMFIAFLPFPTGLLGNFIDNPLAVAIYAAAAAVVSGMEVVLFAHAHRRGLMKRQLPDDVFRWGAMASLAPVLFFALSIPLAWLIPNGWAVLVWFLTLPFQFLVLDRVKPDGTDEYLGA